MKTVAHISGSVIGAPENALDRYRIVCRPRAADTTQMGDLSTFADIPAVAKACRDMERIWERCSEKHPNITDMKDIADRLNSDATNVAAEYYSVLKDTVQGYNHPPPAKTKAVGFAKGKTGEG
eukprot:GHVU01138223.1.p1 GENE.GHVU01138223.1~~GHVU01138223.1.p1  ORF type:complete len:123 (+),score=11.53 GHVU01138223.1:266-634(+)